MAKIAGPEISAGLAGYIFVIVKTLNGQIAGYICRTGAGDSNEFIIMIKINYKQFIRDRTWCGFEFGKPTRNISEWGYRVTRTASHYFSHKTRMNIAMWVIEKLNRWA